MSRSSDISGKPETEVVTAAVKNPGFQTHAQVFVCGGDAQRWRVGTTHCTDLAPGLTGSTRAGEPPGPHEESGHADTAPRLRRARRRVP